MKTDCKYHSLLTGLMVLSIIIISFLAYKDILGYFFTATDTLSMIETSRIQSFHDVVRIFTTPMMNNTTFAETTKYYRPISSLSFGIDYAIWGLNPFGYQLTDLILHIAVSVLVFFFIRALTKGSLITAWLGAVIFTVHPILIETVPAVVRRLEMIVSIFLLSSFLLFLRYQPTDCRRKHLIFSIFLFVLALGTYELSPILPLLIFAYSMIIRIQDGQTLTHSALHAAKKSMPYFIVTFIYIAWRIYILHSMGGYHGSDKPSGVFSISQTIIEISRIYFLDLLYPVDFLRLNFLFSPFPDAFTKTGFMIVLLLLFLFLVYYRQTILKIINHTGSRTVKTLKALSGIIIILSLTGILAYPVMSPYLNNLIQLAYTGKGWDFLTTEMMHKDTHAVGNYILALRDLILNLNFVIFFFAAVFFMGIHQAKKIKNYIIGPGNGHTVIFSLIFLFLPFAIYLTALKLSHRHMYIPIIPFSVIVAVILVESFKSAIQRLKEKSFINPASIKFILTLVLSVSFLAYSPLIRTYPEWKSNSAISSRLLQRISEAIPELPDDAVIRIDNLPEYVLAQENKIYRVRTASNPSDYSIKSWLNLNFPANRIKVVVDENRPFSADVSNLGLAIKKENNEHVELIITCNTISMYNK